MYDLWCLQFQRYSFANGKVYETDEFIVTRQMLKICHAGQGSEVAVVLKNTCSYTLRGGCRRKALAVLARDREIEF